MPTVLSLQDPKLTRYRRPDGYVICKRGTLQQLEHRLVMEEALGRSLLPGETVHHKNGIRHQNDLSNLQLRVSGNHPAGQDVLDLLDWARALLERYGPTEKVLRK